jgi:hypothetical protein
MKMTKILITVGKPSLKIGLTNTKVFQAMRQIQSYESGKVVGSKYRPGQGIETCGKIDGDKYIVEIKAPKNEVALAAGTQFINAYDGIIYNAVKKKKKKETSLMA